MEPDETAAEAPPVVETNLPAEAQPESLKGWDICLVDAHSLIFQVFHALPEMTSPQGEPVGAVFGFARDMFQLMETRRPDALICAFDLPGPTFRHELYDAYKANRGPMPEDLVSQIPKIRETLAALGIPVISTPGYEADDVLATVSKLVDQLEANCLIVTGDKDCRQLITDRVSLYNIRKNSVYDATNLEADWGIRPDQVVDFQALVGDKVDNVPGVPMIGPKAAKELLEKYNDLDSVLAHADEVAGAKRRQNLLEYRDDALMSRKLVRLAADVPVEPDWNAARLGNVDHARLKELFQDFGFRTLGDRAAELDGFGRGDSSSGAKKAEKVAGKYHLVDTPELFDEFIAKLKQQSLISVDTETTNILPRNAEIVGYAIAFEPGEGYYLPVRGPEGDRVLDPQLVADRLRPMLEDPNLGKIGQNLKYDIIVLRSAGIKLRGIVFDTMVASYLLDAGERSHNLDLLASRYLDHTTTKIESLIGKGKNQKRMDEVPVAEVSPYAAEDADIPLQLYPLLTARLEEDSLTELNKTVEVPLIEILAEMEYLGIWVDTQRLGELSSQYTARLQELAAEIEEMAGHPLNIASPKQLGQLLFQELGLPVIKKTKTGPSTDASVLEELADVHPLPAKIVEYRQFSKLLNTYVDALPEMVHPETGRVHASFNQVVAATGRLSSSNPNLQNIPIRTAEGREIRSAFRTEKSGWKLLAADYSQIELRVLAHLSSDHTLCEAFANDEDIHTLVASHVEGVGLAEVTSDMRRRAKAVNFGIIYGQSPFGLAKALGISKDEATEFIETYFASYPGVLDFMTDTLTECRKLGFVTTMLGRKRAIRGIRPVPEGLRETKSGLLRQLNLPERTAVNTVIQGSAADLIKLAMIGVHRRLPIEIPGANMLLQIHDELVFEVAPEAIDALARLVTEEMSQVLSLDVPLKIDVKYGDNWAECEPWEEA
ncbi:MAG: DNA polymerase I [Planctomycetes bacterium]|nr:DNA polymerase I [Planctomycetota bacterium]